MWKSALKLSTMWEVKGVRDLAIKNLDKLDAIDMIILGTEYHITNWLLNGCFRLIMRNHGPTKEECNLLGIGFAVQIYGLREHRDISSFRMHQKSLKNADCLRIVGKLVRETFPDRIVQVD